MKSDLPPPNNREVMWLVLFVLIVPPALFIAFFVICGQFNPAIGPR